MHGHTFHHGKKHFCRYSLQAFSTEEILKRHIKDCFKINGKKIIVMPKKSKYVKFKNYERKIKSRLIIYVDFEAFLVPKGNRRQKPEESYTKKYQKHIACSYDYKLVCVDYKFSKNFKEYLGKDAVYNFINTMIEENKYFSEVIKNILKKNL